MRQNMARNTAVLALVSVSLLGLSGCSSAKKSAPNTATSASATPSHAPVVPTRWWTDNAGTAGSKIDTANPTAAAAALRPDRPTYCQLLHDTVASHNVFANAAGTDPGIKTASKAWVAEATALAPVNLTQAWETFGTGFLALLDAGSKPSGQAFPSIPPAWNTAQDAINADAKAACGIALSSASATIAGPTTTIPTK